VFSALFFGLLFNDEASAAKNDSFYVDAKESAQSINLSWDQVAEKYKVYRDGKLIYEGKDNSFVDQNLTSDYYYNYRIVAIDKNDNVKNVVELKTSTTKEKSIAKNQFIDNGENISTNNLDEYIKNEVRLESSVGEKYVKIDWPDIPDEDSIYEVYRNETLIGETKTSEYLDKTVEPNKLYTYKIVAKNKVSEEELARIKEEAKKYNITLTPELEKEISYKSYYLIRLVKTLDDTSIDNLKEGATLFATTSTTNYTLRYTTFIPTATAPNPFGVFTGSYFKGDNRGFDPFSNKYRTRSDITVGWGSAGQSLAPNYYTQKTILYDKNGNVISEKQASTDGMKVSNVSLGSTKISYKFNHDVGIPIYDQVTPDITYYYNATVYKNGSLTVSGEHDQAPSHELYIMIPNSDFYGTIFQHANQGFEYLFPFYPNKIFNVSL
jgi:hypothetical protein